MKPYKYKPRTVVEPVDLWYQSRIIYLGVFLVAIWE